MTVGEFATPGSIDDNLDAYENAEMVSQLDFSHLTADDFAEIQIDDEDGAAYGMVQGVPVAINTHPPAAPQPAAPSDPGYDEVGRDIARGALTGQRDAGEGFIQTLAMLAGAPVDLAIENEKLREARRQELAQRAAQPDASLDTRLASAIAEFGSYIPNPIAAVSKGIEEGLRYFGLDSGSPPGGSESIRHALSAVVNFGNSLIPDEAIAAGESFAAEKPQSPIIQSIVNEITKFGIQAVSPAMYLRAFTVATPFARSVAWSGIADFINAQPDDESAIATLAQFISGAEEEDRSAFANAALTVLQRNSDDPKFINKARVALDAMVIGGAIEKSLEGAGYVVRAVKSGALRQAIVDAGAGADRRLGGMRDTLSANPIGVAGDLALSAAGKLALKMAPEGSRGHKMPHNLLVEGSGEKAVTPVTQAFNVNNKAANFAAIDQLKQANPDALKSPENWLKMEAEAFGGQYLPVPPMQAINYANDPARMAEKLRNLSPEMKAGVDEGFKNVQAIKALYDTGAADEEMTANLFVWGILSRGAGPVQQESAYIDIITDAAPLIKKVLDGTFDDAARKTWEKDMRKLLPPGSPARQVTMNVNAAGKLLQALSVIPEGSDATVLRSVHDMIGDPNASAASIRRKFMELTDKAGIDNKVVSFILLVAGRDDVLVMDRIQSRHLWDDGRFEGANIYDGFVKEGTTAAEGLHGIMRGPRGLLITEALEDGLRGNVAEAYRMVGREQDASLGRFHWETWVIDGEQVVDHSTLQAVATKDVIGQGVTEGKPGTFSSGARYMRGSAGPVVKYPLSDGSSVYMKPETQKKFEAFIKREKNGIIPKGFKVTERKDIPWYERPEVDRNALDAAARKFADADADGATKAGAAESGKGADTAK
tara:strand:- start:1940 stop:4588 length:2649 start_codon:yes stop_codon:yes gene_type:complete